MENDFYFYYGWPIWFEKLSKNGKQLKSAKSFNLTLYLVPLGHGASG